jgi:tRNA A37 N6-isopentenylltransferase MiaA
MGDWDTSLIIVGPSTSGKTEIAFKVAEMVGGEIINADKYYLVKGFPTMTGLPDFSKHPTIKHHLYEELDPTEDTLNEFDYAERVADLECEIKRRGNLPIIEGSYHRFVRRLLESKRPYVCAGIKWAGDLENRVRKRVEDIVFNEQKGIKEVMQGLKNGWRNTYVMRSGSAICPTVEYLDGLISQDLAREKIVYEVLATAYKARRKFLDFPEVKWFRNDSKRTEQIADEIIELIKKSDNNIKTLK